mgnify:CR=1 FL=1
MFCRANERSGVWIDHILCLIASYAKELFVTYEHPVFEIDIFDFILNSILAKFDICPFSTLQGIGGKYV